MSLPPLSKFYGKNLPHIHMWRCVQFITIRLNDSLPQNKLEEMQLRLDSLPDEVANALEISYLKEWIKKGRGACLLKNWKCAEAVKYILEEQQQLGYRLLSWVIMPNHIHVLVKMGKKLLLPDMIKEWKIATTFKINKILNRKGSVWQRDYYDTYIKSEAHFFYTMEYIRKNARGGAIRWFTPTLKEVMERLFMSGEF